LTGSTSITGVARGTFTGDKAQGIMTTYQLHADGSYNAIVNGAAALQRTDPAVAAVAVVAKPQSVVLLPAKPLMFNPDVAAGSSITGLIKR
jgi:hypothetical protein